MPQVVVPYPPTPADAPDDLTAFPASLTNRQAVLVVSLFFFLAVYVGMVVAAGLATVVMVLLIPAAKLFAVAGAVVTGLTFVFLVKGLVKRSQVDKELHVEVTEDEHPRLFGFIRRLCEEAGVAEPDRVYVSHDVNAAIITRTSLVNLFVPPRRDLLIGLGLVNVLNLSEFKAALAHEFGHLAQGGWSGAYFNVVFRVCADMVAGRDWFDDAVDWAKRAGGWGSIVGYTLGGVVWLFRWGLDKLFGLIAFQRHSVMKEQEYHADLVAARLAGSNAITHALYRIEFGAEAFGQALDDLRKAADHKLYTADLYHHQPAAADLLRKKKNAPNLGRPPALTRPEDGRKVQVFDPDKGTDPTADGDYHPPNFEREENVKERFVAAADDARPAWVLFHDPADLRERLTYKLYRTGLKIPKSAKLADPIEVQRFIDDEHAETTYDPRYGGVYDDRMIDPGDLDERLTEARATPWDDSKLAGTYFRLYTGVADKVADRKELVDELNKVMGESGGATNKRLKKIVRDLEADLADADDWFDDLDRKAVLVFAQMAVRVDPAEYGELVARYRFHLRVQDIYKAARDHGRKAHFYAGLAFTQGELSPDDFAETMHVLRGARKALRNLLREADEIDLPAMKNFVQGDKLGYFLLDEDLVKEFPESFVKGQQVFKLLEQLSKVQDRAARLHFKSLGGILAIQERVATAFLAARGMSPPPPAR